LRQANKTLRKGSATALERLLKMTMIKAIAMTAGIRPRSTSPHGTALQHPERCRRIVLFMFFLVCLLPNVCPAIK
jgi:hypothetical protein